MGPWVSRESRALPKGCSASGILAVSTPGSNSTKDGHQGRPDGGGKHSSYGKMQEIANWRRDDLCIRFHEAVERPFRFATPALPFLRQNGQPGPRLGLKNCGGRRAVSHPHFTPVDRRKWRSSHQLAAYRRLDGFSPARVFRNDSAHSLSVGATGQNVSCQLSFKSRWPS